MESRSQFSSIREWRERDRNAFETARSSFEAANRAAREVVVEQVSPDDFVTVSIDGRQRVQSIRISDRAYEHLDEDQLANLILICIRVGRQNAAVAQQDTFMRKASVNRKEVRRDDSNY